MNIRRSLSMLLLAATLPGVARESAFTSTGKAPLYWMAYEQCFVTDKALEETRYKNNVKWVAANLRDYGYDMICTDGWIEGAQSVTKNGYITKYNSGWEMTLADMVEYCAGRDLKAGIYYNPLWMSENAYSANVRILNTDGIRAHDIAGDQVFNSLVRWVDTDKAGAEEWVKGYVRHFIDLGFKFLRVDFLNHYENAYGTERYRKALRWISEEAGDEIIVSLVMPNQYNHAESEIPYGDMMRISEDVFGGGFDFVSQRRRGVYQDSWANWGNLFDGFVSYSDVERSRIIMDGDFVRLNTCGNDNERRFWITLLVMAGSPIAVADQYDTIGNSLSFYRNNYLLKLARTGFHARPLSRDLSNRESSSIWWGTTADGNVVLAFFNREDEEKTYHFYLSTVGKKYAADAIDLWTGESLPEYSKEISATLPPRSCRVIRFRPSAEAGVETLGEENPGQTRIFNLQGHEVPDTETPGIYVIRDAGGTRKIIKR